MVWFSIGSLYELSDSINDLRKALNGDGNPPLIDFKSDQWSALNKFDRDIKNNKLYCTLRNKTAFHVDAKVVCRGLDKLVADSGDVTLSVGIGDNDINSTLVLGNNALFKGLELSTTELRRFIEDEKVTHLAVSRAVQCVFVLVAKTTGVEMVCRPAD